MDLIDPTTYPHWNDLLLTNEDASFFHTSNWARVLHESYGYTPFYFTEIDNGRLSVLIPVMEVNSLLTGRRGVSLPFTDCCCSIVSKQTKFEDLIDQVIDHGKKAGWKYIEWRDAQSFPEQIKPSAVYFEHTLNLIRNEQELLSSFRESTRRNIKKSEKNGVQVSIVNSLEGIKAFYRLNCLSRREHGLPPQPFRFFKKVYEHVISKGLGHVLLASYGKPIAGGVYFHFGKETIYKYGASDNREQHLRPNNLVMWTAIKWYARNGFENLSFGRTEPGNTGLLQFKRGWGTQERTIQYYRYSLMTVAFLQTEKGVRSSYSFLKKLPLPLLNLAGYLLYRHVG